METIKEFLIELEKTKTNLKKSINKAFTNKYIEEKFERLEKLKETVNVIIENNKKDEDELETTVKEDNFSTIIIEFNKNIQEIEKILKNLKILEEQKEKSSIKMASFDINSTGKSLQMFKGIYKDLEPFISQTEMVHDLLKEEDREIFIKYIYNFKLTTQVRNILGHLNKPTTFSELKKRLEESYPNPKTIQQILTELGTTKQEDLNISDFRQKITELTNELNNFEIRNLTNPTTETKDAIYKVNENIGLNTFIKGINPKYRTILLANMPKTLNEATQRCEEAEPRLGNEYKKVYTYNKQNNYKPGYNKKYQGYNNNDYNKNQNHQRDNNNGYNKNRNYQNNNNKNNYKHNKNYQRNNDTKGYDRNQNNYNNNGYRKNNYNKGYKGNQNNPKNEFNNNQNKNYRAFPYQEQQENCEGRMTEEVVQEGQK